MAYAVSDTLNREGKGPKSLFHNFFCPMFPIFFILAPYATLQSASTGQHIQLCGNAFQPYLNWAR